MVLGPMLVPSIKLRRAKSEDSAALANIAEQTFRDTFAAQNETSELELHCAKHFGRKNQLQEILDPNVLTVLAHVDDELAGFTQVHLNSPHAAIPNERLSEIHRFYVSADYHGLGVAQELMGEVLASMKHGNSSYVWLGVWERNPRAIAFYEKYKFEAMGEQTFLFGSEAQRDLIMARALG